MSTQDTDASGLLILPLATQNCQRMNINNYKNYFSFFVGIGGTGMSAIAQYMQGTGFHVAGSDRLFCPARKCKSRSSLKNSE